MWINFWRCFLLFPAEFQMAIPHYPSSLQEFCADPSRSGWHLFLDKTRNCNRNCWSLFAHRKMPKQTSNLGDFNIVRDRIWIKLTTKWAPVRCEPGGFQICLCLQGGCLRRGEIPGSAYPKNHLRSHVPGLGSKFQPGTRVAAINPKFQADTARGAEWNTLNHRNISRFKQFPIQGDPDRLERRDWAKVPNAGQGNSRNLERGFSPLALLCSGDIPELDTELCPVLESGLDYCGNLKWLHKVHMSSVQNQGWDKSKTQQRRELGSCRDFTEAPSLWGTNSS